MPIDPNNLAGTATQTFDDEFNNLSLWNGSTGWYTNYNFNGSDVATFTGNGELQWYINAANPNTASVHPWTVSNGVLTLTCAPADPSIQPYINNYQYTSGVLTTQFSFSQLYGYFEISAKLPAGQGFWPAFWLLPTNNSFRPEIDVMEVLGQATTSLWQFSHTADLSYDKAFNNTVPDMSAAFHRYGVDWEPDKITFYFDGQVMGVAPTAPEDNVPMFMILDLALGGVWAGPPDGTTHFPGQYQIDYVRAYQSKDLTTGTDLTIGPASISQSEGNSGATAYTYTVTRSGVLTGTSSVSWSVTGATSNAANGADFLNGVLPSGVLTFAAGQSTAQITVNVAGDTVVEPNEGFTVSLANPSGATITVGSASGVIVDDDAPAGTTISLSPPTITQAEGNSGVTYYVYTVTRSGDLSGPTTVDYAVSGSGANPANAADFQGGVLPANKVWFGGGESVKQIWIAVNGDTTAEPDEQFTLTLSNPTGAAITSGVAQGVITNDDGGGGGTTPPSLSISPPSVTHAEGNSGSTAFAYTITRSGDLTSTSSVHWAVAGSGTNQANGADFTGGALPSGNVSFAAGQSTATVTVNVAGDTVVEPDEGFTVSLSNATGATIGTASAGGLITNDDGTTPPPAGTSLSLSPPTITQPEGNLGITWYIYTVTRSGDLSGPTTADYAVTGSSANPASGSDFQGGIFPADKVWFGGGESVKQIWIPVVGDTVPEPTEQFTLTLSNPTGAAITSGVAVGVITDDDGWIMA